MGHWLTPPGRATCSLCDLSDSLRDTFPVVEVDRDQGRDHIGEMIVHYLKIKDGYARWKTPPPDAVQIDTIIGRLEGLRENAAFITVANNAFDENQCVSFNLVPGEEVIIGYANQTHQATALGLTQRIADALGYHFSEL